jgi:SAM-dependent methyltransferase
MSAIDRIHGAYVHNRRVRVLAKHLAPLLPANSRVLDVGCGDGALAALLMQRRPDVIIEGIDVLVRSDARIPVTAFDGRTIPHPDKRFDCVMFVDVLHHTLDPMVLLREAVRVARRSIVLKDHTKNGLLAGPTLRFMDRVGNARHGVALPYNYWPKDRWTTAIESLDLHIVTWVDRLALYPIPADYLFGRSLHFVARLDIAGTIPERTN